MKNTDNRDKVWEFAMMKVVSMLCVECNALKRDTKFYEFNSHGNKNL